jgi:SAM-dependent methyltransferase
MALGTLTRRDVVSRLALRLAERVGVLSDERALAEVAAYAGVTPREAVARSKTARAQHKANWYREQRRTPQEIARFYAEDDNYLYLHPLRYRATTFHFVPRLSPGPRILEYGCGTAPITAWLLRKYPSLDLTVADLEGSSTLRFVRHRFADKPVRVIGITPGELPLDTTYDFIACVDVLEHTPDPLAVVQHLTSHLAPGGVFYTNFLIDAASLQPGHDSENLQSAARQHGEVLQYLEDELDVVKAMDRLHAGRSEVNGWDCLGVYRRPPGSDHIRAHQ